MSDQDSNEFKDDIESLFNPEDFNSFKLDAEFTNESTGIQIGNGERIFGLHSKKIEKDKNKFIIEIPEFDEESLHISLPEKSGAVGHKILVYIKLDTGKQIIEAELKCIVKEVRKDENERETLVVEILDHENQNWKYLLKTYAERQTQIIKFLKEAKGW
ncbi:MAG: hypothetical protein CL678_08260 [Bdellovibrionaceae bacterium]|nr:hypothetical protein [Pseudobdellovibrionaceae bacterium]|tara:strand:- start:1673 stop:2149 length:477 start_codon:yes stop_codon:yes gene_type:complete